MTTVGADGGPPPGSAPLADLTGVCFRDQLFLNFVGGNLAAGNVFDYFAHSPFYDRTCSNEQLRVQGIHPLDSSHLIKMTGWEYALSEVQEPHLFVLRKQRRDSPERVVPLAVYYVLDGSIYQAPNLQQVLGSRLSRMAHYMSSSIKLARQKLQVVGRGLPVTGDDDDDEVDNGEVSSNGITRNGSIQDRPLDVRDVIRVDQILAAVFRKLPPAPPPAAPVEPSSEEQPVGTPVPQPDPEDMREPPNKRVKIGET